MEPHRGLLTDVKQHSRVELTALLNGRGQIGNEHLVQLEQKHGRLSSLGFEFEHDLALSGGRTTY